MTKKKKLNILITVFRLFKCNDLSFNILYAVCSVFIVDINLCTILKIIMNYDIVKKIIKYVNVIE